MRPNSSRGKSTDAVNPVHENRLSLAAMVGSGALVLGLFPLLVPRSPELVIVVPVILALALCVLLYPFAGLFLIVLLTQLGDFIYWILPAYASWVL